MRSPLPIALAALAIAAPAAAQTSPKANNAAQFVMQSWNNGGARATPCEINRWNQCHYFPEDRKIVVTQGPSPCVLEIRWPSAERGDASFRVDFATAFIQRPAIEGDQPTAIYIEGMVAKDAASEAAYRGARWLRVESGEAMNPRVFRALRALSKMCRDKSLGF